MSGASTGYKRAKEVHDLSRSKIEALSKLIADGKPIAPVTTTPPIPTTNTPEISAKTSLLSPSRLPQTSPKKEETKTKTNEDGETEQVISKSLLSNVAILQHMQRGTIQISSFNRRNLSTSSYDVCLGQYYYRETSPKPGMEVYNPWSRQRVRDVWGTRQEAKTMAEWCAETKSLPLDNIPSNALLIFLAPGETILGHTLEFIGGSNTVTTMMKARSSMGRNFIEVCKCVCIFFFFFFCFLFFWVIKCCACTYIIIYFLFLNVM